MIKLESINKKYGSKEIFVNSNLEINENGLYAFIAPSGIGKTTLFNIMIGLTKKNKGKIIIKGKEYKNKKDFLKLRRNVVGLQAQENHYFPGYTVIEYYNELSKILNIQNKGEELLEKFNVLYLKNRYIDELSGGQKRLVGLISALLKDDDIIILDEPIANVDEKTSNRILNILSEISKDKIIIFSTHKRNISLRYVDYIIEIYRKELRINKNLDKLSTVSIFEDLEINEEPIRVKKRKTYKNMIGFLNMILTFSIIIFITSFFPRYQAIDYFKDEITVLFGFEYRLKVIYGDNDEGINRLLDIEEKYGLERVKESEEILTYSIQNGRDINVTINRLIVREKNEDLKIIHGAPSEDMQSIYFDKKLFENNKKDFSYVGINKVEDLIGKEFRIRYDEKVVIAAITDTGVAVAYQTEDLYNQHLQIDASIGNENVRLESSVEGKVEINNKLLTELGLTVGDEVIIRKNGIEEKVVINDTFEDVFTDLRVPVNILRKYDQYQFDIYQSSYYSRNYKTKNKDLTELMNEKQGVNVATYKDKVVETSYREIDGANQVKLIFMIFTAVSFLLSLLIDLKNMNNNDEYITTCRYRGINDWQIFKLLFKNERQFLIRRIVYIFVGFWIYLVLKYSLAIDSLKFMNTFLVVGIIILFFVIYEFLIKMIYIKLKRI